MPGAPGGAFDVASSSTFSGRANPDARDFVTLEVAELPHHPLRFAFIAFHDDDGSIVRVCTGVEIGRAIDRENEFDHEAVDIRRVWKIIDLNFDRYRVQAELRLIPTEANLERARRVRRGVRHKPREPWTREQLVNLVELWRSLEGDSYGRIHSLAEGYGVNRSNIHRALVKAERDGLIEPGERPRRSR